MPRVLVVDDSPVDRRLAGRLIEKLGDMEVFYAEDGQAALEQVEAHLPDLVVTDMQMPRLDGFELVEALKAQYPLIPVILMTAAGSEAIAVQALQVGAASYVPKTALADDLADVTERVLAMSRTQRTQTRLMNRVKRSVTEYEVENDRELVLSLSSYMQQQFNAMKICADIDGLRIGIALEEALLNAFYHGNLEVSSKLREEDCQRYVDLANQRCGESPYKERRIYVTVSLSRDEASWIVRDDGPGFDPSKLPDPTDPEYLELPHGRGLMLMRTFMTEVVYNDKGNEVRMVKRRKIEVE
ncbi:MAG: response regulator [Planctomycetaceae bacterium]|nr:response regulator [Planctomycetaceae bacterium]